MHMITLHRHTKLALLLAQAVLFTAPLAARADTVFTFSPAVITAPDTRTFANSNGPGGSLAVSVPAPAPGATYNFLDSWNFTLAAGADVQAFVGSINFTDGQNAVTSGINNLQLNLLYLPANNGPSTAVAGWNGTLNLTGAQQLFSVIATTTFAPGDYALNVRGLLVGPTSAYAGTLQALSPAAVPLPGSAPMLAGGLGLLAWALRRRTR
jgi:hypothetical protein